MERLKRVVNGVSDRSCCCLQLQHKQKDEIPLCREAAVASNSSYGLSHIRYYPIKNYLF